jgi:GntR family transcriptional regulator
VLFSGLVPAPEEVAKKLAIRPGEELARLDRLRLADGEPMSVEESYLVHRYCPGVLEGDYASSPLREALERDYGLRLVRARQVIRAIPATPRLARLLAIKSRSPLLSIERVSFSQRETPVEFLRIYYRGDRYSLYNDLQG